MTGSGDLEVLEKSALPPKRRLTRAWVVSLGLIAACLLVSLIFWQQILWGLGAMLVDSEPPQEADIAVVLAGDGSGHRIMKAADLVRQGICAEGSGSRVRAVLRFTRKHCGY